MSHLNVSRMESLNSRRTFIRHSSAICAASLAGFGSLSSQPVSSNSKIRKRDAVYNVLSGNTNRGYVPAGFFVHFGDGYRWDNAAVSRHLEYFHAIDMDFIKIQYEQTFPLIETIKRPQDWTKMPYYKKEFYEKQLYVVEELVRKGKKTRPRHSNTLFSLHVWRS